MGRIFTLPWSGTVTAAGGDTDLWEISPSANSPVAIRMIRLGQISEVKDAEEEGLRVRVLRMTATVTSGNGTAGTAEEMRKSGQSPGLAWEFNGATVATTTGATEVLDEIAWINRMSPVEIWYPDIDFAPQAIQNEKILIRLETTLADDMTFSGTVYVEEL